MSSSPNTNNLYTNLDNPKILQHSDMILVSGKIDKKLIKEKWQAKQKIKNRKDNNKIDFWTKFMKKKTENIKGVFYPTAQIKNVSKIQKAKKHEANSKNKKHKALKA